MSWRMPAASALALAAISTLGGCARPHHQPPAAAPSAEARTLRLYIARHGETDWNRERRIQGVSDIPLNATGRLQAEALAARLASVKLDRIYASPLSRSRETAAIAARGRGLEVAVLEELAERHAGAFQGLRLDGSEPEREAEYRRRSADPLDSLDGGESPEQHHARARAALAAIRAAGPGEVLVVAHGGTNPLLLRELLELTAAEADAIRQGNDELYLVEIAPGRAPRLWKRVERGNLGDL